MTADRKLQAILAAVQTDPGRRGVSALFHQHPDDFAHACRSLLEHPHPNIVVHTGFYIPAGRAFETDGPLGAFFLFRALEMCLKWEVSISAEPPCQRAVESVMAMSGFHGQPVAPSGEFTHEIWLERSGPARDGRHYTMRGIDITDQLDPRLCSARPMAGSIGIGDGGNEIGMGKIPQDVMEASIPHGRRIHCHVPTDHLIVAGVSNWGAYALAAGVFALRNENPPDDLFDPDTERRILDEMVRTGPLVDGVTGRAEPTVDGLTWEEYIQPMIRMREILTC